jgi:hypothetical protein
VKEPAVKADKARTKARAEADEARLEAWVKTAAEAPAEAADETVPIPATVESAAVNHEAEAGVVKEMTAADSVSPVSPAAIAFEIELRMCTSKNRSAPQSGAPHQSASHLARALNQGTLSVAAFFVRLRSNTRERGCEAWSKSLLAWRQREADMARPFREELLDTAQPRGRIFCRDSRSFGPTRRMTPDGLSSRREIFLWLDYERREPT